MAKMHRNTLPDSNATSCSCEDERLYPLTYCKDYDPDHCVIDEQATKIFKCYNCDALIHMTELQMGRNLWGIKLCPDCDPTSQPEFPDVEKISKCFSLAQPSKGKVALVLITKRLTPDEVLVAIDAILEHLPAEWIGTAMTADERAAHSQAAYRRLDLNDDLDYDGAAFHGEDLMEHYGHEDEE